MNDHEYAGGAMLSRAATVWFWIALVPATIFYAFLACFSTYGMLFEPAREFFMHLIIVLSGTNGLAATALTLKRKLYGTYWSIVPVVLVFALVMGGGDTGFRPDDVLPMALLLGVPAILLLSQIPTLRKLKSLGPGWGLGSMAYTNPNQTISRKSVWWFRIAHTLSFLVYLGLLVGFLGILISDPPRVKYSLYMMGIAAVFGLFAILLVHRKELSGALWSLAPCLFLVLGGMDIGFGRPLRDFTSNMLPFSILASLLLFSLMPYLKKSRTVREKGFQKTQFTNGASLSDEDLSVLHKAWVSYGMGFLVFYVPCMGLALLLMPVLSRSIGGAVGNFSGVALLFAANIFAFIMIRARKKRYLACLARLGLTERDVRQALVHKKQGTVAEINPAEAEK